MRYTISLTVAVFATMGIVNAHAQSGFSESSDILGFSLPMGKVAAKAQASQMSGGHSFSLPASIRTRDYQVGTDLGIAFNKRSATVAELLPDGTGLDMVRVLFDPNEGSNKIIAITRQIKYGYNSRLTESSLSDSLIEKYGKPDRTYLYNGGSGGFEYMWIANKSVFDERKCITASNGLESGYFVIAQAVRERLGISLSRRHNFGCAGLVNVSQHMDDATA